MILRPYQQEAVNAVYEYLRTKEGNPCIVIPTGGGKSCCLAKICSDAVTYWNGRVLVLAHVKELLEQNAAILHRINPEIPVGIYSAGLGSRDTTEPVIVAGIQSVYQKADSLGHFDLIIVDECFPVGTRIATPRGDMPIEDIYVGQSIYNASGVGVVEAISARTTEKIVQIRLSHEKTIRCTPNHPFFTEKGWCPAERLEKGTHVYSRENVRVLREYFSSLDKHEPGWVDKVLPEGKTVEQAKVLLDLMFQDAGKPDVRSGSEGKNDLNTQQKEEEVSRNTNGQWTFDGASATACEFVREWLDHGVYDPYHRNPENGRGSPCIQGRFGNAEAEACDRIGWILTPIIQNSYGRQTEGEASGGIRVENVEVVELESPLIVYNLQVSKHPSYYADGILVHNCHLLPSDGEGMYQTFLKEAKIVNPNVRLIGLTATPYRMKSGMLCGPENLLNEVCYEIGVKELIVRGYLCPLKSKGSSLAVDTSNLHVRGGEFVPAEVEQLVGAEEFERAACHEIVARTKDRNSVLVFAASVERAESVCRLLKTFSGSECAVVTGETPQAVRDILLRRFKGEKIDTNLLGDPQPPLKYLVNVNVLTTGFDAPNVDCVVLLRPTASPGLFYQMIGRSFRLHESKTDSLVLDYGNNILRHGPVDMIQVKDKSTKGTGDAPAKECPKCHQIVHAAVSVCNECGFEFPKPETRHQGEASSEGVISGETTDTTYTVFEIDYNIHQKFGTPPDAPRSVRVDYIIRRDRYDRQRKSEWVCPEHSGWARKKFEDWWKKRSDAPPPDYAEDVVEIARSGGLRPSSEIVVRKVAGEKFDRIIKTNIVDTLPSPPPVERTCGQCGHFTYGFCGDRQQDEILESALACESFTEPGDVPF